VVIPVALSSYHLEAEAGFAVLLCSSLHFPPGGTVDYISKHIQRGLKSIHVELAS
jgi:hypothetical protein